MYWDYIVYLLIVVIAVICLVIDETSIPKKK